MWPCHSELESKETHFTCIPKTTKTQYLTLRPDVNKEHIEINANIVFYVLNMQGFMSTPSMERAGNCNSISDSSRWS